MPSVAHQVSLAYQFDELSDSAKEKARDWYRGCIDEMDFSCEIEEFVRVGEAIGIDFDTHEVKLMSGKTRQDPNIYWSVGYCQSDYASFEGTYDYKADAELKLREINDDDAWEPLRIAMALAKIQCENMFGIRATIKTHNYGGASVEVVDRRNEYRDDNGIVTAEKEVGELMSRLMQYLYKQLRDQSDYLHSDENIDECIEANEYAFDEEGNRHGYA